MSHEQLSAAAAAAAAAAAVHLDYRRSQTRYRPSKRHIARPESYGVEPRHWACLNGAYLRYSFPNKRFDGVSATHQLECTVANKNTSFSTDTNGDRAVSYG
uniref:Putative secreted peptide n=1 Tax=Anopheles braziliensis TaxID=58242 RepID=A0A2M3ZMS0_9DIPT